MTIPIELKFGVWYLAQPYSHKSADIREIRVMNGYAVSASLAAQGVAIINTIHHTHEYSKRNRLPTDFEFWRGMNHTYIDSCRGVIVCTLAGWQESRGIADELEYAAMLGKPVYYTKDGREFSNEPTELERRHRRHE